MDETKTVERYDSAPLRGKPVKDEWGNLRVSAILVTPGVYPYRLHTGETVYEYKPEDEIYSDHFISSLRGATVTDGHPAMAVTPDNSMEHVRGHVTDNVGREPDGLGATLLVKEKNLIDKIDSRQSTQVSIGLNCVIDPTPGVWTDPNGKQHAYRRVQRHMTGNSVAVVKQARVPSATLRLDSAEMIEPEQKEKNTMSTMRLDIGGGNQVELESAAFTPINGYIQNLIGLGKALRTSQEETQARLDASEEKVKELDTAAKEHTDIDVDALVKDRMITIEGARKLMKTDEVDKLIAASTSNEDIRKTACLASKPEFKLDGKEDHYIAARFDHLVESSAKDNINKQAAEVAGMANNAAPEAKKTIQQRMDAAKKELSNAWRKAKAS